MFLVGLTGNYGTGKSTVLKTFQNLGALTYDADKIVESLLQEKEVLQQIRNLFGDGIFQANGGLDKQKVDPANPVIAERRNIIAAMSFISRRLAQSQYRESCLQSAHLFSPQS